MVKTCAYAYPSGKTCGRIPRRGETLCHDHRRIAPADPGVDRSAFEAEMFRECERLEFLPLDDVLDAAQQHFLALDSFMERRSSPRLHAHYTKLGIALTAAIDRLLAQPHILARAIPGLQPKQVAALTAILWNAQPQPGLAQPEETAID
jgi:hypothetical protein